MNFEFQMIRIYAGHLLILWIQDICLFVFYLFFPLSLAFFNAKCPNRFVRIPWYKFFLIANLKVIMKDWSIFDPCRTSAILMITYEVYLWIWHNHLAWFAHINIAACYVTVTTWQSKGVCDVNSCERGNTYLTKLLGWLSWRKRRKKERKKERKKKKTQCAHLFTSICLNDSMFVLCLRPILSSRLFFFFTSMSMSRGGFGD